MSASASTRRRTKIGEYEPSGEARSLRHLPRLIGASVRLLWAAGPREFVLIAALQLVGGGSAGVQVFVVRGLVDALGRDANVALIVAWLAGLATLTLLTAFAVSVQFELNRLLSELVSRKVAASLFRISAVADLETFETPEFHDRLERSWSTGAVRSMQLAQSLLGLVGSGASVLGIIVALAALVPALVPVLVIGGVPILYATTRSSKLFYQFTYGMTPLDRQRMYLSRVLTHRQHAHEVIANGVSPFLTRRWNSLLESRLSQLRALIRQRLWIALAASAGMAALFIVPVGLMSWLLLAGRLGVAPVVAAVAGIVLLRPALQGLISSGTQLYEVSLYLDDYERFVNMSVPRTTLQMNPPAPASFEHLVVENVSFTYPQGKRPALQDVSLELRRGEVVALVGENGSGKTTLAKLLSGLYQPATGRVLWDGQDVAELDADSLRARIAVLFQDFCQYLLSVRENIGVGRHELVDNLEAIRTAAQRAGADRFISELRAGYETLLGPEFEGGANLSIGQWQRVALARACIRDASFVILDEPTAALDARAEHDLFESIREVFRGRTVLLITHRFSSARAADRIYVLRNGRLVESGAHDDLMQLDGSYAELFKLQAARYQEPSLFAPLGQ